MRSKENLPSLAGLPARALSRLTRNALIACLVVSLLATAVLGVLLLRPAHRDISNFRASTQKALIDRNRELIRSAIERSAGDMVRLLGAAEEATYKLVETVTRPKSFAVNPERILPLEKEFYPGGRLLGLLNPQQGYEKPVTFEAPQIKLGSPGDRSRLSSLWSAFFDTSKSLHAHHPELKWLYLGTEGGSFLVFPSSPQLPPDYDPRKRDWYQEAMKSDKLIWTSPYFTAGGNDLVLTAATRVTLPGMRKPVVAGVDVVMADIVTKILSAPYCDRCVFYLVNSSGQILGKKGDPVLGKSWMEPPKARTFAEDLQTQLPTETSARIAQAVLAASGNEGASPHSAVSRAPKASWITPVDSKNDFISVPIINTHWQLVGLVPNSYAGKDGETVLASLSDFANRYRLTLVVLALAWVGFSVLIIFILARQAKVNLRTSLLPTINQFSDLAKSLERLKLEEADKLQLVSGPSLTQEHALVVEALGKMGQRLQSEAKEREELAIRAKVGEHAREVAHNMRSPLKALEMIVPTMTNTTDSQRKILKSVVKEIQDLANSLHSLRTQESDSLSGRARSEPSTRSQSRTVLLSPLLEAIVSERRIAFRENTHLEIQFEPTPDAYGLFVNVEPTELRSMVANLINNGFEALPSGIGAVQVKCVRETDFARIEISDSGTGLKPEILKKVLSSGGSFDKPGGTGIGLKHARASVARWSGTLQIEPNQPSGTVVRVNLPVASTPDWFLPAIRLEKGSVVYIADDDESLLLLWQDRLKAASRGPIEIHTFSDLNEFKNSFRAKAGRSKPGTGSTPLVLMDYEFKGQSQTGLDAIEELGVSDQSILISAHSDEDSVISRARFLGVRVLPKAIMEWVPIHA